jgi:hypothetical protein
LSFRIKTLSIFQNPQTQLVLDEQIREDGVLGVTPLVSRVFNNKAINYSLTFSNIYFNHFSYDFLFTDAGFPARYRVPGMGLLYFFELPLIIFGIWRLFSFNKRLGIFLTGWILLAPVGSALTFDDVPNLQRTLFVFPAISILTAVGFISLIESISKNIKSVFVLRAAAAVICLIIVYNFFYYIQAYYVHQVVHRPLYRQEGYEKLAAQLNKYSKDYNKVVVTSAQVNPTIFLLFYNKYNPASIQKVIKENGGTNYGVISFDKFLIDEKQCPLREEIATNSKTGAVSYSLIGEKGILYVDDGQCKIPNGVRLLSDIKRSDNASVFKLVSLE